MQYFQQLLPFASLFCWKYCWLRQWNLGKKLAILVGAKQLHLLFPVFAHFLWCQVFFDSSQSIPWRNSNSILFPLRKTLNVFEHDGWAIIFDPFTPFSILLSFFIRWKDDIAATYANSLVAFLTITLLSTKEMISFTLHNKMYSECWSFHGENRCH